MIRLQLPDDPDPIMAGVTDLPVEPEEIVMVLTGIVEKFKDAIKLRAIQGAFKRLGDEPLDIQP